MANSYVLSKKEQDLLKSAALEIQKIQAEAGLAIQKMQASVNGIIELMKAQNDLEAGPYELSEDFTTIYLKKEDEPKKEE